MILKIVIGLVALSLIVFFHELGHFIFAKIFGVRVLSFSIGMGPVLLHKTINGTDYRISLIPLGGYCGMEGEKDFQKAIEENLPEISTDKSSLYGVHPVKRCLIAFAGPLFNFIMAIFAYTIIAMVGYTYYSDSTKIIIPDESIESPAREAGLQSGDVIKSLNGKKVNDFTEIAQYIYLRPKEKINIEVERNGETIFFEVTTLINKETGTGLIGIQNDPSTIEKREAKRYSFFPAIAKGAHETLKMTLDTLKSFGILFSGIDVTNVVSGPARITTMFGEAVTDGFKVNFRAGLYSSLEFVALISISLGIMNLLPIPVLDGGLILFGLIAIIIRREVPPKLQYKIQCIGIFLIVLLFILGMTGDVKYFIKKFK